MVAADASRRNNMSEERRPSIDERIQALTMNLELLLKQGEEQDRRMEVQGKRMDRLHEEIARHEQDMQRFRRALRPALEAYLGNGDQGDSGKQE
jgi:hypothetical protein